MLSVQFMHNMQGAQPRHNTYLLSQSQIVNRQSRRTSAALQLLPLPTAGPYRTVKLQWVAESSDLLRSTILALNHIQLNPVHLLPTRQIITTITIVPATTVWLGAKSFRHKYDRGSVSFIHFDIATLEYINYIQRFHSVLLS